MSYVDAGGDFVPYKGPQWKKAGIGCRSPDTHRLLFVAVLKAHTLVLHYFLLPVPLDNLICTYTNSSTFLLTHLSTLFTPVFLLS